MSDTPEDRVTRHDLTHEEWEQLAALLPGNALQRRPWADHRTVINGVLHRVRAGHPWRDLPERFGPWKTVYNRHRPCSGDGAWEQIAATLRLECDREDGERWSAAIDSTVVRAHQHAAGARHLPTDIPTERLEPIALSAPDRARGTGQRHDSLAFKPVMARVRIGRRGRAQSQPDRLKHLRHQRRVPCVRPGQAGDLLGERDRRTAGVCAPPASHHQLQDQRPTTDRRIRQGPLIRPVHRPGRRPAP
jgi:transposase